MNFKRTLICLVGVFGLSFHAESRDFKILPGESIEIGGGDSVTCAESAQPMFDKCHCGRMDKEAVVLFYWERHSEIPFIGPCWTKGGREGCTPVDESVDMNSLCYEERRRRCRA